MVNAAFLQEIKEDNRQLRTLFNQTVELLSTPRRTRIAPRHVVDQFWRLRDQLAMHFTLEDAFGYFADAIAEAPHLSERAESLHSEHDDLFLEMCDLIEEAEQLLYHERPASHQTDLAVRFFSFHADFQEHEARENELILQALDDDIGVGD
jgi:hypothetical protein